MWLDTGIVIAYIVLLIVMSLRGGRNVRNAADFTASGGRYGTLIIFAPCPLPTSEAAIPPETPPKPLPAALAPRSPFSASAWP